MLTEVIQIQYFQWSQKVMYEMLQAKYLLHRIHFINLPTTKKKKEEDSWKHRNKFKQPKTAVISLTTIYVHELSIYSVILTLLRLYGKYIYDN